MHDHAHSAHHDHVHSRTGDTRILTAALAITLGFAAVEVAGGWWSGSLALMSDAGHMFSDATALMVAAVAAVLARRPPGLRHSYGWQRAEVLGATLNSLLLLAVVTVLAAEAVQRVMNPRPVIASGVMVIAAAGLAVNAVVAWMLSRGEGGINMRMAFTHVIADMMNSIIVLVSGAVIYFTGWVLIDPVLSLLIAALILTATWRLLCDALHVLMEGVPPSVDLAELGGALARIPGVLSVHDLHVWSITPGSIALSAHVELADVQRWSEILEAAERMLNEQFGIRHVTLQPEERGRRRPQTAVIRLWRGNPGPPSGVS